MDIPKVLAGQEVKKFIDLGEESLWIYRQEDINFYNQPLKTADDTRQAMELFEGWGNVKEDKYWYQDKTARCYIVIDNKYTTMEVLGNKGKFSYPIPPTINSLVHNLLDAGIKGLRWKAFEIFLNYYKETE